MSGFSSFDNTFVLEDFCVLVFREVVILELRVKFVERHVFELAEHQSEEHAHVGVVMQWHFCPFFNEEKYEAIIFIATDCYAVKLLLEVVWIVGAGDAQLLRRYLPHVVEHRTTVRI